MSSRLLQGFLGFVVGFALAVAIEAVLVVSMDMLFNVRMIPRGIGWIAVPIISGTGGWKFGQENGFLAIYLYLIQRSKTASRNIRIWLALSILWVVAYVGYVLVFAPYQSYWQDEDYIQFAVMLVGLPLLALLGVALLSWATRDQIQ